MNLWICDTESTGLSQPAGAVELGLLQIDEHGNELCRYESLINPHIPIELGAQAIHGISDADVADAPTIEEFFQEMRDDGADFSNVCFIAHNSKYDHKFYSPHMDIKQQFCTLAMSRRDFKGLANYKLATVAQHCGVAAPEELAHTAMGDVLTVHGILRFACESSGRNLATLIQMACKPVMLHAWPFGKYQGRSIVSTPRDYREHMLTLDLDADLRYTLEQLKRTGA